MANTVIQILRTSVAGRAANTTTLPNPGQIAVNMTDQIMYSTNGSVIFEIGANVANQNVRTSLVVGSNVTINTSLFFTGNTTVNSVVTSTSHTITNPTTSMTLTASTFNLGNSTVNAVINTSSMFINGAKMATQSDAIAFAVALS